MLLAIDIGNTMTELCVFDEDRLVSSFKIRSETDKSEDEHRLRFLTFLNSLDKDVAIDSAIICSVVPVLSHVWFALVRKCLKVRARVMGPGLKSGIAIRVDDPSSVGSDLIADAVGALKEYGPACFIADLGTASKFILLDKNGAFAGCVIAPGFGISMESLVDKTSALPEVNAIAPKKVIGKNTIDCMNSGIVYGAVYEINGFAEAFEREAGYPLKRILTGGYGSFVHRHLQDFTYNPTLLMTGLRDIDKRN